MDIMNLYETKLHRLRKVPLVVVQLNGSVLVVLVVVARRKQDQLAPLTSFEKFGI